MEINSSNITAKLHYLFRFIKCWMLFTVFLWNGVQANPNLPGGQGSVSTTPFASFMSPATNLSADEITLFYSGRALAHQPWVKAPSSTTARDGLGPIYNARTCLACHINGGRGLMPIESSSRLVQGIVRLSVPGSDVIKGVIPDAHYGDQLQTQSIALAHQLGLTQFNAEDVRPEANVYIDWSTQTFTYDDGQTIELRKPKLRFENLAYGKLGDDIQLSLRNAPAIIGGGLLEQIPEQAIIQNVTEQSRHKVISGRLNKAWNPATNQSEIGRFGWKANKPNLLVQTAAAFHGDMGISNPLFPNQPCMSTQINCLQAVNGNDKEGVEINEKLLQQVTFFVQHIGVPSAAKPKNKRRYQLGKKLFAKLDCVVCHTPSYTTKKSSQFPALSEQKIWPYTDLLLHDMGEALADGRTDFLANGREWKTPPLWGIGLSKQVNGSQLLLHDGRARSVEEAIIWHSGEAQSSKLKFTRLSQSQRQALIYFVESL